MMGDCLVAGYFTDKCAMMVHWHIEYLLNLFDDKEGSARFRQAHQT
jgi:hypothetical protein